MGSKYDNLGANKIQIQTEDSRKVGKFYRVLLDHLHNLTREDTSSAKRPISAQASIYRQRIQSPYGAAYISPVHRPAPVSPPEPAFTVREFGLPYGSAQLPFLRPSQHYCQRIESPAHTQYTYNAIQRDTHT